MTCVVYRMRLICVNENLKRGYWEISGNFISCAAMTRSISWFPSIFALFFVREYFGNILCVFVLFKNILYTHTLCNIKKNYIVRFFLKYRIGPKGSANREPPFLPSCLWCPRSKLQLFPNAWSRNDSASKCQCAPNPDPSVRGFCFATSTFWQTRVTL